MQEPGNTLFDALLIPGDLVLSTLGFTGGDQLVTLLVVISLIAWSLLVVAGLLFLNLFKDLVRTINAWIHTGIYRATHVIHSYKTRLVLVFRKLLPRTASSKSVAAPMVEFDDLDLAVLRSAAARGPGFTTSAPELADQLPLRPVQIQRSLEKLRKNKMLEAVIGSTDGFGNYRLSQLGTAYMSHWQQPGAA